MSSSPFRQLERRKPTWSQRLFGRKPVQNAFVELLDTLRRAASPREVTADDVARIEAAYGIDIRAMFRSELVQTYRDYMLFCLTDRRLSDDELADLAHLSKLFGFDAATCEAIHRNVARRVYLRSVNEVLADGTIDASEREFLRRLREHLEIPQSIADNILEVKERQYRSRTQRDVTEA